MTRVLAVERLGKGPPVVFVHGRDARRHPEATRLGDRQGTHRLRALRGGEEGDHRPVGVPHQVGSLAQELGEHRRLDLEVVALQRRAVAEAGPAGDDQGPVVRQLALLSPGQLRPDDVPVDEDDGRALAEPLSREHCA